MSEQSWKPLFRTPTSTVTKVLRSPVFLRARELSADLVESPAELRTLADRVEALDHLDAPLSAVADRVFAAVRFLRATADRIEARAGTAGDGVDPAPERQDASRQAAAAGGAGSSGSSGAGSSGAASAGVAARERLLVASLLYLVTPDDLVPDFRAGGYIDDVLLLSWVFGAAVNELAPYLDEDVDGDPTP
jgi:hypothetical protein